MLCLCHYVVFVFPCCTCVTSVFCEKISTNIFTKTYFSKNIVTKKVLNLNLMKRKKKKKIDANNLVLFKPFARGVPSKNTLFYKNRNFQ